jgi:hypothetical protein
MLKIVRYSDYGFIPQYQTHHMRNVLYCLNDGYISDMKVYPEHLLPYIIDRIKRLKSFYETHKTDFEYGVWAFIENYEDEIALNHLDHIPQRWTAIIDNSARVYDVNWEKEMLISDSLCECFGCYIPYSSMHLITNIQKGL